MNKEDFFRFYFEQAKYKITDHTEIRFKLPGVHNLGENLDVLKTPKFSFFQIIENTFFSHYRDILYSRRLNIDYLNLKYLTNTIAKIKAQIC